MNAPPSPDGRGGTMSYFVPVIVRSWPALLVLGAGLADACGEALTIGRLPVRWLDFAAAACLGWAALARGGRRGREEWATTLDGRVLAAAAIAVLQALPHPDAGFGAAWLHQMFACAVFFYALVSRLRRDTGALDAAWVVFAVATMVLGAHALFSATAGLARLVRDADAVDVRWAARHGLARALALATLVTAGRAWERGTAPAWRAAALVGITGCGLHAAAGGYVLQSGSLERLNDPLFFSCTAMSVLLLVALVRHSWAQQREHPGEAWRWRALAAGFTAVGIVCLLGETSGEGVRVLVVLGAVLAVAGRETGRPRQIENGASVPELARAA